MNPICQISEEPGGDLVLKNSRLLPNIKLWVKKTYWDQGYEPRGIIIMYGRQLLSEDGGRFNVLKDDAAWRKIIEKRLYFGKEITVRDLL
jgi:hypothetical protein